MKGIVTITIVIYIFTSCLSANAKCIENVEINDTGMTTIRYGNYIRIEVAIKKVKNERFEYAVNKISIIIDGKRLFVPRSVYGDLYEPNEGLICSDMNSNYLEITGGDGSESYFVRIYFDKKQVRRRIVFSSMIPDKPLEETVYWQREL